MDNTDEKYDLFEDVITKIKYEPLTRAEQHAQLERVIAAAWAAALPKKNPQQLEPL